MTSEPIDPDDAPSRRPVAPQLPPGRYGPEPSPRRRRRVVIALSVAAVLGVALVVWLGLGSASKPVTWKDVGFVVKDSESTTVTFDVAMKPGTVARCTLNALAEDYSNVGTVTVTVGPSTRLESRYTATIRTSQLATTGVVDSCRVRT